MEVSELSAILSGKTILDVTTEATPEQVNLRHDIEDYVGVGDADDNAVVIVRFSDGSYIHVWSSEWGGISYGGK